jgi:hypothetical protein
LSDIFGNVVRPMLQSVEGYDANQIVELPGHEVTDYCIEVSGPSLEVEAQPQLSQRA